MAGTMHRPSDSLQPQGYSLDVPMLIICNQSTLPFVHLLLQSPRLDPYAWAMPEGPAASSEMPDSFTRR